MESIVDQLFNFLSIELTVMLTAALPIIELRGAIPVGISLIISYPCCYSQFYWQYDSVPLFCLPSVQFLII